MILNSILAQYEAATGGWYAIIFPIAHNLFLSLVVIEIIWAGLFILIRRDDMTDAMVHILRLIFSLGFAYTILLNANTWIPAIINSFMGIGAQAAGGLPIDPSSILDQGITLAGNMLSTLGVWGTFASPVNTVVVTFAAILVIVAFALIAALLLYLLVSSYVVIGGGVLLLGFGGSRWTRVITERYLSYAISLGVKLFVLYLVIAVANTITQLWATGLAERSGEDTRIYFEVLGGAIVYLILAWRIPETAGDMMHGIVSFTMHEGERMGASAMPVGMAGGHAIGGAAMFMGNAGAAIASAVQSGGQKMLTGPSSTGSSGGGSQSGGSQGSNSAPVLNQFRNAGQGASNTAAPQTADLSFMKDGKAREALERFGQLGKEKKD